MGAQGDVWQGRVAVQSRAAGAAVAWNASECFGMLRIEEQQDKYLRNGINRV